MVQINNCESEGIEACGRRSRGSWAAGVLMSSAIALLLAKAKFRKSEQIGPDLCDKFDGRADHTW